MAEGRQGMMQVSEIEFEDMYKEIKELRARISKFQLRVAELTMDLANQRRDNERNIEYVKLLKQRALEKGVSIS
jgi:hypothetical protein